MNFRNIELKSEFDLIYFDEYRTAKKELRKEAEELFREGMEPEEIVNYCRKKTMCANAQKLKEDSKLGKRFQTRTFENFKVETKEQKDAYEKALDYAQNIEKMAETGKGIIFAGLGKVGNGKTHLACAIANHIIAQGYATKVINITGMIYQIKSDFKVEEFVNSPVLVIDDLGKENGTKWVTETLYHILNERYEAMRPTIVTTEYGLEELKNNYTIRIDNREFDRGTAIVSRLTEDFLYVPMTGDDYRKKLQTLNNLKLANKNR